ncbi:MAG: bifunctional riboflavin kinase/FAD synthetase [Bacteroidetes bacterium]|nr:bifunctional riboflavin kinase/FAD synthetase [Bacteroidota bacterium]
MQIHRSIDQLPTFRRAVVTVGTFDGVHTGHRQVLDQVRSEAFRINGESVLITFHPHPRSVVSSPILGIRLINTLEERIELLQSCGIDHLVIVPFTELFANLSAEQYVRDFLVNIFHPHTLVIGYDHRFGRDRDGDFQFLKEQSNTYGFSLMEISPHLLEANVISSSRIRDTLLHHQIEYANRLLGYPFFFSGMVVHGNKIGRTLGYPTANLQFPHDDKIIPGNGIYAVFAQPEQYEKPFQGMMSIGFRPTVGGTQRVVEVNLFAFDADIYDRTLKVHVFQYLRAEVKFDGLPELVAQMHLDKQQSLRMLPTSLPTGQS